MLPFNEIGLVKKRGSDEKKVDENVKHQHLQAHEFFLAHTYFSTMVSYLKENCSSSLQATEMALDYTDLETMMDLNFFILKDMIMLNT